MPYYVDIGGSGDFFSLAYNVKVHVQYFSEFYVHINVREFINGFMHLCLVQLRILCGEEKRVSQIFY